MCYNLQSVRIKSRSAFGVKTLLVPCGHCDECSVSSGMDWSFRLSAEGEFLASQGWKCGFFTLTYRESQLPRVPAVSVETGEEVLFPVFCKRDIQRFIYKLRHRLYKAHLTRRLRGQSIRDFLLSHPFRAPRWLIASEYGGRTARPHYHGIIFIPPEIDPDFVHKLIKMYWRCHGFICPKDPEGCRQKKIKPFLSISVTDTCKYVAKYVCKDMCFEELFKHYSFNLSKKELQQIKPFHAQSRSLGACWLEGKDEHELLHAVLNGVPDGPTLFLRPVPRYLRNKILFRTTYEKQITPISQSVKRIVGRAVTDFFLRNFEGIFKQEVNRHATLLTNYLQTSFWLAQGFSHRDADRLVRFGRSRISNLSVTAQDIVTYSGLRRDKQYDLDGSVLWFSRYDDFLLHFEKTDKLISFDRFQAVQVFNFLRLAHSRGKSISLFERERTTLKHQMEDMT